MKKKKNKVKEYLPLYLMMLPGLLYLLINNYLPMTGIILAFKKLNFSKGILASPWAGLDNFKFLFSSKDAWIITRNTLLYNIAFILVNMVVGIAIAILICEEHKNEKNIPECYIIAIFDVDGHSELYCVCTFKCRKWSCKQYDPAITAYRSDPVVSETKILAGDSYHCKLLERSGIRMSDLYCISDRY